MIDFTDYIWFFTLFDFSTSWREVKWLLLWNILIFLTFCFFDPLVGGLNNHFYWIYSFFWTFRPLAGRSNWSTLLDTLDLTFWLFDLLVGDENDRLFWIYVGFFRLFDFSTSWWVVKIIDLLNIFVFLTFRLFDLLVGGQNDQFQWLYWFFFDFTTFDLLLGV